MLEMMEFLQDGSVNVAWFNFDRLLGIVGLVLAFVAIGLAYYHVIKLGKVSNKVSADANRLDEIKESLSTRYLGEFPRHFPKIVEVIKEAEENIIIFCDYPGYGSFTDRKNWIDYKHAIEQKLQDRINIELTCFDEQLRRRSLDEQFFDAHVWDKWKLEKRNVECLKELLKWHPGSPSVSELSKEQFSDLMALEEQAALDQTFRTATITSIDSYVPLYFWIADKKRAVFTIATISNKEYGFFTIDRQIISALIEMRDRYRRTRATHEAS